MVFDYFYGKEADAYSFYRIPKILFIDERFKVLSVDAKVLYGLLLDRMSLSVKNQWFDIEGKVFVYYSIENIMESIGCSKNKAVAILKELDDEVGIGLVEKKRMGQGKPSVIYVKNFIERYENSQNQTSERISSFSESLKINPGITDITTTRSLENTILESHNLGSNNKDNNYTEINNTDSNPILSVGDGIGLDLLSEIRNQVREKMDLDVLVSRYSYDQELLQEIYDLVVEVLICEKESIVIASGEYPISFVKEKFAQIDCTHVEYVIGCLSGNTSKIHNIKKYLLATLFNASTTIKSYYRAEVNHDFPQYAKVK